MWYLLQVGADGSKSRVRELAGFTTTGWNYSQNAVICTVEHSVENRCAWQRFLPAGPIALLPIGDNFSNIVWTMNPKEATDRKVMPEVDFLRDINYALDYGFGPHPKSSTLGNGGIFSWLKPGVTLSANECFEVPPKVTKLVSERMVFPLSLRHANDYASKHVVLIGDAAHTVHPLAGQGVNMGFGDAFALSKVIAEGIAVGTDIGEVDALLIIVLGSLFHLMHLLLFEFCRISFAIYRFMFFILQKLSERSDQSLDFYTRDTYINDLLYSHDTKTIPI